MDKKNTITIIISLMVGVILFLCLMGNKVLDKAQNYYQVYLNGNIIGVIENKDKLYELIDNNQSAIKEEYGVSNVYPPTNLKIVKTNTYSTNIQNEKEIYEKIEKTDDFTIKGYKIYIKGEDKDYTLNVLDKDIFYEAAKRFVRAFLDENEYEKYINNNQDEIVETGRIIRSMSFLENIVIKEAYISVNEKIYKDELELSQFLLFGENPETKTYTVKLGDSIESVSNDNELNPEEFLIANTKYQSKDSLLRVGDTVNVTLINPQLTFIYKLYEVSDEIVAYTRKTEQDSSKSRSFREVTRAGQSGINRVTEEYTVTNGEREQGVEPIKIETIREVIDQITTVGTRNDIYIPPAPVDISGDWGWPTNRGYVITSRWGWRWGKMHQGIDISGAGNFGSPIFAVADGRVIYVYNGCPSRGKGYGDPCGGGMGNSIIIEHANGFYTRYAHLTQTMKVSVGQTVSRGQQISTMGNSGSSTGVHLHFAVAKGSQTAYFDPMSLYGV